MPEKSYQARYREKNLEKVKAYQRRCYQRHKAERAAYNKKWAAANPEAMKKHRLKYYATHPNRVKAKAAKYQKAHPDQNYHHVRAYKLRVRGAEGTHTLAEWYELLARHEYRCYWHPIFFGCNLTLTKKTATRDHVIPISKGGANSIQNIVPACRSCNCKKHTKLQPVL